GSRYTARCPFHEERTPSFSVNAVDKLYYCFGCGAKGDLITFVRETEGLDFAGAIEWLGELFRVPLEYEESSPAQDGARLPQGSRPERRRVSRVSPRSRARRGHARAEGARQGVHTRRAPCRRAD